MNTNNNSSWVYSEKRKQYYYSPLGKPFFNFTNPDVVSAFTEVIKFYISQGASGIRIRNVPYLLVDPSFEDETNIANTPGFNHFQYGFFVHSKTENLPAIGKLLTIWKNIVRNLTKDGPFMVKEELQKLESYKVENKLIIDLPIKTHLFEKSNVSSIVNSLNHTYNVDNIEWPLWKVRVCTISIKQVEI